MKSSGLFPHRATRSRGNVAGGSAGNSSSNNRPTSGDGYKEGMLGWRSSRQSGGQSMGQKMDGRPRPNDTSLRGEGGLACDSSAAKYLYDTGKPASARRS
jgi:hypothetical protein